MIQQNSFSSLQRRLRVDQLHTLFPAIMAASTVILILILFSGQPILTLRYFFTAPFSSPYAWGNLLAQTSLLLLTGIGTISAFRCGSFNLGGEGQMYASSAAAIAVAIALERSGVNGVVGIITLLLTGTLCGALIAAISGYARMRWGASEMISSFLTGSALFPIVDNLFRGPLLDPQSNLLQTVSIASKFQLQELLSPSRLSFGAAIAFAVWLFSSIYYDHGKFGTRLRLSGENPEFALTEGLNVKKLRAQGFILSGAFHGLAGALLLVGMFHSGIIGFSAGYGWNGIAVALIAANRPKRLLPAALFISFITSGSQQAAALSSFRIDASLFLQGILFLLITIQWRNARKNHEHHTL